MEGVPRDKAAAFTMIELIVVMVIIGIIAAFSVPGFDKASRQALSRDAVANLTLLRDAVRLRMANGNGLLSCADPSACTAGEINSINGPRSLNIIPQKAVYGYSGMQLLATAEDGSFKVCAWVNRLEIDAVCEALTPGSCAKNVGTCPVCGDGNCLDGEDCSNCSADCGACSCPETDAQMCGRFGRVCESLTEVDTCGNYRAVADCGSCTVPGQKVWCGATGQCDWCAATGDFTYNVGCDAACLACGRVWATDQGCDGGSWVNTAGVWHDTADRYSSTGETIKNGSPKKYYCGTGVTKTSNHYVLGCHCQ